MVSRFRHGCPRTGLRRLAVQPCLPCDPTEQRSLDRGVPVSIRTVAMIGPSHGKAAPPGRRCAMRRRSPVTLGAHKRRSGIGRDARGELLETMCIRQAGFSRPNEDLNDAYGQLLRKTRPRDDLDYGSHNRLPIAAKCLKETLQTTFDR